MRYAADLDRWSQCLLIPGRYHDDDGFIVGDGVIEGLTGDIQRAISIKAIREAAHRFEQVGLVDRDELALVQDDLALTRSQLEQVEAERDELQAKLDRVQGLARDGFKVQRQQGRPPTNKTKVRG